MTGATFRLSCAYHSNYHAVQERAVKDAEAALLRPHEVRSLGVGWVVSHLYRGRYTPNEGMRRAKQIDQLGCTKNKGGSKKKQGGEEGNEQNYAKNSRLLRHLS